jgi:hypothetical protein
LTLSKKRGVCRVFFGLNVHLLQALVMQVKRTVRLSQPFAP